MEEKCAFGCGYKISLKKGKNVTCDIGKIYLNVEIGKLE
jgi:hypothetical protein